MLTTFNYKPVMSEIVYIEIRCIVSANDVKFTIESHIHANIER